MPAARPTFESVLSRDAESAIVERARQGDKKAFNTLAEKLTGALTGHVLRTAWWADHDDAADIVQATWEDVWHKLRTPVEQGGYDSAKGRLFTWIKAYVLDFKIRRWAAREKHRESVPRWSGEGDEEDWLSRVADPDEDSMPDVNLENRETLRVECERLRRIHLAYMEFLRLLFLCGGYPHQQLSFSFSKLVYGHESDRGTEGSSIRLSENYGSVQLDKLLVLFWDSYRQTSGIPEDILRDGVRHAEPLRLRLRTKVRDLVRLDGASLAQFEDFCDEVASKTRLEQYWSKNRDGFTSAIPDWCYKIKMRMQKLIGVEKGASEIDCIKSIVHSEEDVVPSECGRCKLRHLPPCADIVEKGTLNGDETSGSQLRQLQNSCGRASTISASPP